MSWPRPVVPSQWARLGGRFFGNAFQSRGSGRARSGSDEAEQQEHRRQREADDEARRPARARHR